MRIGFIIILFCSVIGSVAMLNSCKHDTSTTTNETITTMKVVTQNLATNAIDTFEYVNFNETKPNPPSQVDTIRLQAKNSYSIQIILLNEIPNIVQEMTDTIMSRADYHLMVYNIDPAPLFTAKILDKDSKGLPVGLMSTWITTDSTNGWLRMILRHQPGHKNGTETPGNNDFEADFPVVVR
jgi:hypothetical protein